LRAGAARHGKSCRESRRHPTQPNNSFHDFSLV
jgi:hypothetical protein